jgi:hypothetical protein
MKKNIFFLLSLVFASSVVVTVHGAQNAKLSLEQQCLEAIHKDDIHALGQLLDKEPNVNSQNFVTADGVPGQTLLMMALRKPKVNPMLIALLTHETNADIDLKDAKGNSARSLSKTQENAIELILQANVDHNPRLTIQYGVDNLTNTITCYIFRK